ncbi:MAG: alpha-L-fucosidase [Gemmatimonadota bacterium]
MTKATRREFIQASIGVTAAAAFPELRHVPSLTPPAAKPLLQLQQEFVDLRFGMFNHFNMATFQDREWGDPHAPQTVFNPTALDTDQWARAAKSAGMTWGCLTPKHHDGFCLWPTATPVASISQTASRIDVVRSYVDSFRREGLKVAFHFSILDLRNDIRHFNVTPGKIALIKAQLTELLTHYGAITIIMFDGWDAPWSRISYEEVPFREIYDLVKRLQPDCLVADLNASQYPSSALYYSDIKGFEQNAGQGVPGDSALPALACVTLTDGWFWKEADATRPLKSVSQVVDEWLIPENRLHVNVILNAPPTREGRLAPNVVERLAEIGRAWHPGPNTPIDPNLVITTPNLATRQHITASDSPDTVGPDLANDGSFTTSFYLPEGQRDAWIEVTLDRARFVNTLVLVEPVGQWKDYPVSRIASYRFERWSGGRWVEMASGLVPARVQIHRVPRVSVHRMRLSLTARQDTPHIADIGLYDEPA